jgi:hypothetical protein
MNRKRVIEPRTKTADIKTNKETPKVEVFSSTRKSLTKPITESILRKNTVAAKMTKKIEVFMKSHTVCVGNLLPTVD